MVPVKRLPHETDHEFAETLRRMAALVRGGVGDTERVAADLETQARGLAGTAVPPAR